MLEREHRNERPHETVRRLELAVVQAAMADHRGCAPETCGGSRLDPCHLANTIQALIFACDECNAGGHTCPGDGNPIKHGQTNCGEHGTLATTSTPAADELAEFVARLVMEYAQEWASYVKLPDGRQGRLRAHADHVFSLEIDGQRPEFHVTVSARRLPPVGPENDGALQAELAATTPAADAVADELIWVDVTWAAVVAGDRVRLPLADGQHSPEAEILAATRLDWHADPRSSQYQPIKLEHGVMRVRFTHESFSRDMDPDKPVQILLTHGELAALKAISAESSLSAVRVALMKTEPAGSAESEASS